VQVDDASAPTPPRLEKPCHLAGIVEIDLGCGGHLRQARHAHDVAAHENNELGASGKPDLADVDFVIAWRAAQLSFRRKGILRIFDAKRKVSVAALLQPLDLGANF
jgi:hypothetical protein